MKLTNPIVMHRSVDLDVRADQPKDDRRVPMIVATETPVRRGDYEEVLLCTPEACDMSFFGSSRAPLLVDHDLRRQVGVIEAADVSNHQVRATARLSRSSDGQRELDDIRDKVRGCVSIGYEVLAVDLKRAESRDGVDQIVVTNWRPVETSLCSVPLDRATGIVAGRSAINHELPAELIAQLRQRSADMKPNTTTPDPTPSVVVNDTSADVRRAESKRQTEIRNLGQRHQVDDALVQRALESGQTVTDFASTVVLPAIESRQADINPTPVDLPERERNRFSIGAAARAVINGTFGRGREGGLEHEVHQTVCRQYGVDPGEGRRLYIPWNLLGRAVSVTTGSAQHLVPQQHSEFQPFLVDQTAMGKVCRLLTGLRGDVDLPGGDTLGSGAMKAEDSSVSDSEMTFKNTRLSAHEARTRATFSRRLLENSVPATDAEIERALTSRISSLVESQCFTGDATSNPTTDIDGLDNSSVTDADLAAGAITYSTLVNMKAAVDNAKALLPGPFSYITSYGVVAKALTTPRFGTGGSAGIVAPGGASDEWQLDGDRVLRSHLVATDNPSDASPSQTIAHTIYAGCFQNVYLATFGPGLMIEWDPFSEMGKNNVVAYASLMFDLGVPIPACIARADNALIA